MRWLCLGCALTIACSGGTGDDDAGVLVLDGGGDAGKPDGGSDAGSMEEDSGSFDAGLSDAGMSDAGSFDAGDMPCAFASTLDQSCANDGDCRVAIHQTDCCGNTRAIGINASEEERFAALEPACQASYPLCGCPSGPTQTDSGESSFDGTIEVGCISRGPRNVCLTYIAMRPEDAP